MAGVRLRTPVVRFAFESRGPKTDPSHPAADPPDWLLALLEGDGQEELSHELITAASLLYARRLRPGIGFDAARALIADYEAPSWYPADRQRIVNSFSASSSLISCRPGPPTHR